MWPLRALVKVSAIGTFGLVGAVLLAHEEIQARIRKSECYKEAFRRLQENNGVLEYFGEPIKAGFANNIYDTEDASDSVLWYKVPLRGPNGKGTLYYKTVKEQKWFLSRIELELAKLPGRKLLLMEKSHLNEGELTEGEFTAEV